MKRRVVFFVSLSVLLIGAAVVSGQVNIKRPVPSPIYRPDLVPRITEIGSPTVVGEQIEIPLTVVVQNMGLGQAVTFAVSTRYETVSGSTPGRSADVAFRVPGQANQFYPMTSSTLQPAGSSGDSVTFRGKVIFDRAFSGTTVKLYVIADSMVGDEFLPDYGRVRESNESNNSIFQEININPGTAAGAAVGLALHTQTNPGGFRLEGIQYVEVRNSFGAYSVTVVNNGTMPSGELRLSVQYEITRGSKPGLPAIGTAIIPDSAGRSSSLAPRERRKFDLPLTLPLQFAGLEVKFRTQLDYSGGSFQTMWTRPSYIPKVEVKINAATLRDILQDKIFGIFHLNNFAGPTSDFQLDNEPYRRNDYWVIIDRATRDPRDEEKKTLEAFSREVGAERYWYYVDDLNGGFSYEDVSIKDGKIVIRVEFETGGSQEIRGWVYVWPYWYDTPPDFDISRFNVDIYLTPALRNGKISYSGISAGLDLAFDFANSNWRNFDRVMAAVIGEGIMERMRRELPISIRKEVVKQMDTEEQRLRFENEVESAIREEITRRFGALAASLIPEIEGVRGDGPYIIVTLKI